MLVQVSEENCESFTFNIIHQYNGLKISCPYGVCFFKTSFPKYFKDALLKKHLSQNKINDYEKEFKNILFSTQ